MPSVPWAWLPCLATARARAAARSLAPPTNTTRRGSGATGRDALSTTPNLSLSMTIGMAISRAGRKQGTVTSLILVNIMELISSGIGPFFAALSYLYSKQAP